MPFIILQADTRILLGGSDGSIHQFKNNGKQISTVATGSDIIYSLAVSIQQKIILRTFQQFLKILILTIFRNHRVECFTVEEIEIQLMFTNITDTEPTKLFSKNCPILEHPYRPPSIRPF